MRAVTRVNTVQASIPSMQKPTRHNNEEGRCGGEASEIRTPPFHRGSGDGTHAREPVRNKGSLRRMWSLVATTMTTFRPRGTETVRADGGWACITVEAG